MRTSIRHDPWPVAAAFRGIYAHGVETPPGARLLYVSGQIGVAPDGSLAGDFRGQCEQALANVAAVLESARLSPADIVKMTFYLVRREDMDALIELRRAKLDGVRPAVTTLFVAGLVSPQWLVEIEAVACAP
jgi:enamine deaminase RidA (YjgF/YER057c/UK114 family)